MKLHPFENQSWSQNQQLMKYGNEKDSNRSMFFIRQSNNWIEHQIDFITSKSRLEKSKLAQLGLWTFSFCFSFLFLLLFFFWDLSFNYNHLGKDWEVVEELYHPSRPSFSFSKWRIDFTHCFQGASCCCSSHDKKQLSSKQKKLT